MLKPPKSLRRLIKTTLTEEGVEYLIKESSSKSRYTRVLKDPGRATNAELLLFAEVLKQPAYLLHHDYGLAHKKISKRELAQHKFVMEVSHQMQAA